MLANEAATKRRDKVFMAERVRLGKRKFQAQPDKSQTPGSSRFALAPADCTRYRVGRVRENRHFGHHRRQSLAATAFCQTGARPGRQTARRRGVRWGNE